MEEGWSQGVRGQGWLAWPGGVAGYGLQGWGADSTVGAGSTVGAETVGMRVWTEGAGVQKGGMGWGRQG